MTVQVKQQKGRRGADGADVSGSPTHPDDEVGDKKGGRERRDGFEKSAPWRLSPKQC